jgi:3-hydroxyacyl-CoA dehydrogenase
MQARNRLAVIGAGTMGHGIAQVFAQAGLQVALSDSDAGVLGIALQRIGTNLETCLGHGTDDKENPTTVTERITAASDLAEAVSQADFVVEAVFEDLEVKHEVLRQLEELCPAHVIITSTTSSYRVRDMAVALRHPERFLATHFWNPPYVIPVVEVMPGEHTASEAVETTFTLLEKAGKVPALVKKDTAGFVGNRPADRLPLSSSLPGSFWSVPSRGANAHQRGSWASGGLSAGANGLTRPGGSIRAWNRVSGEAGLTSHR